MLILEKIDRTRNAFRFYALAIEPTLFGDASLIREWGRIGRGGRRIVELHADEGRARARLDAWAAAKRRRGYAERG